MPLRFNLKLLNKRVWQFTGIFLGTLSLIGLSGLLHLPSFAQTSSINRATITEIIGNQVLIKNRQAKIRDTAVTGEQIRTTQARTQLNFNTGAMGRLGENSSLTLGRQCFQVERGQILVTGAASGCTSTVRAGVRGTTYHISVDNEGESHFRVLEGSIELFNLQQPGAKPIRLNQGQGIIINRAGRFGKVRQMQRESYEEILRSNLVEGFETQIPSLPKMRQAFQELFPGVPFPREVMYRLGWDTRIKLERIESRTQNKDAIRINVDILNKPSTRYANAIYQLYARQGQEWVQIYNNRGARLILNQSGAVSLKPEVIPVQNLWLQRLGDDVKLSDLELRAVVLVRYDMPGGDRDLRFQSTETQYYRDLPRLKA